MHNTDTAQRWLPMHIHTLPMLAIPTTVPTVIQATTDIRIITEESVSASAIGAAGDAATIRTAVTTVMVAMDTGAVTAGMDTAAATADLPLGAAGDLAADEAVVVGAVNLNHSLGAMPRAFIFR